MIMRSTSYLLRIFLIATSIPTARSQPAQAELEELAAEHPGCFQRSFEYKPSLSDLGQEAVSPEARSLAICQSLCQAAKQCAAFTFFPAAKTCHFADSFAELVESRADAIAGSAVCPERTQAPSERCRSELPGNGFPGLYQHTSNEAWPSGHQPWSLQCWPKNWAGGYVACQTVSVLEDTAEGWPGHCSQLKLLRGIGEADDCRRRCLENPLCASWHAGFYGQCFHGVGRDCYSANHVVSLRKAQRLQHGEVRVLMDLTGWHIVGLHRVFERSGSGSFQSDAAAVVACKKICYSDIKCQYWQYSPVYGCYVEDASQEYGPPYPLTLDWAYRNTQFALSCIAGEFVQHYCPSTKTTAYPTKPPEEISSCMRRGFSYKPLDMGLLGRTVVTSAAACQARCRRVLGCGSFTYLPDGGCHVQIEGAARIDAEDIRVISGPPWCHNTSDGTTTLAADWPAHVAVAAGSSSSREMVVPSGPEVWSMDEEAASPYGTRAKDSAGAPGKTGSAMILHQPFKGSRWWCHPWPLLLAVLCTTGIVMLLFLRRPMRDTARRSLLSRDDDEAYESRLSHHSDSEGVRVRVACSPEHSGHDVWDGEEFGDQPSPLQRGRWMNDNQRKAPQSYWSPSFHQQERHLEF